MQTAETPPIPATVSRNCKTLLRAAQYGNLALMSCLDAKTKEPAYVLCAVNQDGGEYVMVPFARMAGVDGSPFDEFIPPV